VPAAIAVVLFAWRKKAPALACAGLVGVAALGPVLGFVSFEFQTRSTVADHYLYLPMLAAAMSAAWIVTRAPKRSAFYAAAVILGLLSIRTMDQTRCWNDSRALFTHAIAVNPRSDVAFQNLGVLAGFDAETAEAKAELYMEQHDLVHAHEERAEAMTKLAESDALLARVLELKPGDASALHSRAALHARFGRHEEAIADLRALVKELPKLREDEQALFGHDDDLLGRELIVVGRPGEALAVFEQMLAEDPGDRAALRGKDRALAMIHQASTQPSADARGEPRG
jgi:tetratricopeptide (TPR) repeat protein